jgi:hypothetical protein
MCNTKRGGSGGGTGVWKKMRILCFAFLRALKYSSTLVSVSHICPPNCILHLLYVLFFVFLIFGIPNAKYLLQFLQLIGTKTMDFASDYVFLKDREEDEMEEVEIAG